MTLNLASQLNIIVAVSVLWSHAVSCGFNTSTRLQRLSGSVGVARPWCSALGYSCTQPYSHRTAVPYTVTHPLSVSAGNVITATRLAGRTRTLGTACRLTADYRLVLSFVYDIFTPPLPEQDRTIAIIKRISTISCLSLSSPHVSGISWQISPNCYLVGRHVSRGHDLVAFERRYELMVYVT